MIMTRTGSELAFTLDDRTIAIDVHAVQASSLAIERVAGGLLVHALVIARLAAAPLRIEASPVLLAEIHRAIGEAMLDLSQITARSYRPTRRHTMCD